jgi:hypothetical protein
MVPVVTDVGDAPLEVFEERETAKIVRPSGVPANVLVTVSLNGFGARSRKDLGQCRMKTQPLQKKTGVVSASCKQSEGAGDVPGVCAGAIQKRRRRMLSRGRLI